MLLDKKNKEVSNVSGGVESVGFSGGYEESGYSSGMSGGFSADSKETYEAAKLSPLSLRVPGLDEGRAREIETVREDIAGDSGVALEIRKLDAKINSIIVWIKSFYSNFSRVIEEINALSERLDERQRNLDNLLKDVEDLKKRAEVFIGTEELLKLNDKIKSNLDRMTSIQGSVDKRENIPIDLLEKTAVLAKQNKEALGSFTFKDYEEKIDSILKVVENLAEQISEIKSRAEYYGENSEDSSRPRSKSKKGETKKKAKGKSGESYEEILKNIGEMPELPDLPSQKTKRTGRLKKNK